MMLRKHFETTHSCSICGKLSTDDNCPWTEIKNNTFSIRSIEFCCHHDINEMAKFIWDNVVDGQLPSYEFKILYQTLVDGHDQIMKDVVDEKRRLGGDE